MAEDKKAPRGPKQSKPARTFEVGFWVRMQVYTAGNPELFELVGEVQAVDERGIRVTPMNWLLGRADGWDYYIPWSTVVSSRVATPDHDVELFLQQILQEAERQVAEEKAANEPSNEAHSFKPVPISELRDPDAPEE